VSNTTGLYPRFEVDTSRSGAVGQAGGVLLTQTVAASGLGGFLSSALTPWRKPWAIHDPAKVVLDLAVTMALGGGLPGRRRGTALRAAPVRAGRLGPDGLPHDRGTGRRCPGGVEGDQRRPGSRAGPGVEPGRAARSRPRHRRRQPAGRRPGRDAGQHSTGIGTGSEAANWCVTCAYRPSSRGVLFKV